MQGKKLNLVGERFGHLTVIEDVGWNAATQKTMWLCRCDCGNETTVPMHSLRRGNTRSCGCQKGAGNGRNGRAVAQRETVLAMRAAGSTLGEIANQLGVAPAAVKRVIDTADGTSQVYALRDPRTGERFYVGSSKYANSWRYRGHIEGAVHFRGQNEAKETIIRELVARGLKPELEILETGSNEDIRARESYWINKLARKGEPLTNVVGLEVTA